MRAPPTLPSGDHRLAASIREKDREVGLGRWSNNCAGTTIQYDACTGLHWLLVPTRISLNEMAVRVTGPLANTGINLARM